ncbi:MAG: arginine--tRNA ligase, partial [Gammaproteobacteria bacterium]
MKETVSELLQSALAKLQSEGTLPADQTFTPQVGNTKDKAHGDYACNIALVASKSAGCPPRQLAEALIARLPESSAVDKVEIAGPGFINFFMSTSSAFAIVETILKEGDVFGRNNSGQGKKVQVEFVSANPTGPLHVGHGRGAAIGDCLCRLLEANGYDVTREFYYNDAGAQINNLALSV